MSSFYTNYFLRGKYLYLRRIDNGVRSKEKIEISPKLYVHDKKGITDGTHRDIFGNPLVEMDFDTPSEARNFIKGYEDVEGFKILGFDRFESVKIDQLFPENIQYRLDQINVASVDIETEIGESFAKANDPHQRINAISLSINSVKIKSWSLYDVDVKCEKDAFHVYCNSEEQLMKLFLAEWRASEVDIVTGWNSSAYDLPYIAKRMELVIGEEYVKQMSPWGMYEYYTETNKYGSEDLKVKFYGIADLDLQLLYRKFVLKKLDSYKLDNVAYVDLKESKTEYEGTLKDLYTNDPEKFIIYNQQDVRLVNRINAKRKLIELAILIAYISKGNFEDAFSTMRPWDNIIGNHLRRMDVHVPISTRGDKSEKFKGAVVKDPSPGFHPWVMSFDLESLYPSIMRQYNISPETIIDQRFPIRPDDVRKNTDLLKSSLSHAITANLTLTANGTMYKKDVKGFIPLLVGNMFDLRKTAKGEMLQWENKGEDARKELERRRKERS